MLALHVATSASMVSGSVADTASPDASLATVTVTPSARNGAALPSSAVGTSICTATASGQHPRRGGSALEQGKQALAARCAQSRACSKVVGSMSTTFLPSLNR